MELLNATKMKAAYTMGMEPSGRELLVVVVKGTFQIPSEPNKIPELADEQVDLVMADEFTGEPGFSAPIYESDFAPVKPRADILFNGSAHAPDGVPAERVGVGIRVGTMTKTFEVVGNRTWEMGLLGPFASPPEPFVTMPISYDNAFGGTDESHKNKKKHAAFAENPVGRGFHVNFSKEAIEGELLPNTEEFGRPVKNPMGRYKAMSLGPVGRSWKPRPNYGGTYDQDWIDNVFPFLPADFDEHYYQCAPADQQLDKLDGGEKVVLLNLASEGHLSFKLPTISVPVTFYLKKGDEKERKAVNDTLIIEPDLGRFTLHWRVALPLKKNMFEVAQVVVGRMSRGWYRAREMGKTYYPSLSELVDERRAELKEVEAMEEAEV